MRKLKNDVVLAIVVTIMAVIGLTAAGTVFGSGILVGMATVSVLTALVHGFMHFIGKEH